MAKKKLSIIPLGGVREIGKNLTVLEYDQDILVIDAGLTFPGEDQLGIDLVIPNIAYLEENRQRLQGIVLTHGHEDHIGALPYLLPRLGRVAVYGTRLTLGLLQRKLEEHRLLDQVDLQEVQVGQEPLRLGAFAVEWLAVNHSIPDGCALAIDTPVGTVVHSGDFKIDHTPIDGRLTDLARLGQLGREKVLVMICDATNAERPGHTPSERAVGGTLEQVFATAQGRLLLATFASNLHRLQQIINLAARYGRRVALAGRSIRNNVEVAQNLGYLELPDGLMAELDEIERLPPHRLAVITTGSQGEPMAALTLMANREHRQVEIRPGDTVVISSTAIPGNERLVSRTIDNLYRLGADVVYGERRKVHVSGHASREELKLMINLVRPRYLMPFHGEYRHLIAFREVAGELGISRDRVLLPELGDRLEFTSRGVQNGRKVTAGPVLIDGSGIGDVGKVVLRDRQTLAENGILVVVMVMEKQTGQFVSGPDIITRGFIYVREAEELLEEAKKQARRDLREVEEKGITEWSLIKARLKNTLATFFMEKTARRPIILPMVIEI